MAKITNVSGRAITVVGDDIDTDRIVPARFLKEITFAKMGEYPFYDERFDAQGNKREHPFNSQAYQGAKLLIANSNFGCGSSREHAPQALARWGIQAIVAESYGEIFTGNCTMLGVPTVTASSEDIEALQKIILENPQAELTLDLEAMVLRAPGREVKVEMPAGRRKALVEGIWDSTALLTGNSDKVKETAAKLPYLAFAPR